MIVVATYHILPTADPIVRELIASGVGPDDIRVSDHVDPVAANAPGSIEKEGGFFAWLTGVEDLDVDAYRRAVQRGRTVVTVRTTQPLADKVEAVLQKFDPVEVTEPETAGAASPGRGVGESVGEKTGVRRYLTRSEKQG